MLKSPAVVELADEILPRDDDIGEEDLVEVRIRGLGQFGDGPVLDARRAHVDHQHADALVLRRVRVGAHETEAPVGVLRAGGPHLLAVHDELVAVFDGAHREGGKVAPRVGFAHAEAPADLGAQRRQRPPFTLFGRAVVDDRRRHDRQALRVGGAADLAPRELLEIDHLLGRVGVAPAELGRPAGHEIAVVEQRALPRHRPRPPVGTRLPRISPLLRHRRRMRVEPPEQLRPEGLVLVGKGQSHRAAPY